MFCQSADKRFSLRDKILDARFFIRIWGRIRNREKSKRLDFARYPILKRFEDMGAVRKQIEQQEGRPNRHIYTITSIGSELLSELLQDFPEEIASNDNEFLVRVGLFDLLDLQTRKRILQTRKSVVEKKLIHLQNIVNSQDINSQYPFPYRVIQFLTEQQRLELEWIMQVEKDSEEIK